MGRFVRIDKDKQKAVLLNLDLVATVELAPHSDLLSSNSDERRVNANFLAADKTVIASLHFDDAAEAHAWVAANLGVQMG